MEGVEDIPGTALHEGIQWEWETFEEYLDALDRRRYAIDIAAFLPHAPLRVYVMGERGANNEDATADDIAEMATHVRAAIEAGAVGFSTSRSLNHTSLDGELVPGTFASADELTGLAQAVVDAGGGLFEVVPTGETGDDAAVTLGEIALMAQVSKATGIPVSFLLIQSMGAPELWREQLDAVSKATADGALLIPQVAGRPGGMLLGVASYHGLMRRPTFRALEDSLPLDELLVELNKPEVKAQILSETDLPPDPRRQFESLTDSMPFMFGLVFPLGDPPEYEPTAAQSIAGIAEATGRDPWEVL
jgi:N-acyl-D-aspartate/D-glutamate deacylase